MQVTAGTAAGCARFYRMNRDAEKMRPCLQLCRAALRHKLHGWGMHEGSMRQKHGCAAAKLAAPQTKGSKFQVFHPFCTWSRTSRVVQIRQGIGW